jgi:hypothetical protein
MHNHRKAHCTAHLATIDGNSELDHDLLERNSAVVHHGALTGQLAGPHPVALGLDVFQRRALGPHDVGQCLSDRHARVRLGGEKALDGLLANGRHAACDLVAILGDMALSDDCAVGEGCHERAYALLLGNQARDAAVHLVGQEALGADRYARKYAVQSIGDDLLSLACKQRLEDGRRVLGVWQVRVVGHEGLLRHLAKHLLQGQVDGNSVVLGVVHYAVAVIRHFAHAAPTGALTLTDLLEGGEILGIDQRAVVLLVLSAPDLKHRHGVVTKHDVTNLEASSRWVDDLLEHVAVASSALVVDGHNRVARTEIHARANNAIHFLLHLSVTALHGVEVKVRPARNASLARNTNMCVCVCRISTRVLADAKIHCFVCVCVPRWHVCVAKTMAMVCIRMCMLVKIKIRACMRACRAVVSLQVCPFQGRGINACAYVLVESKTFFLCESKKGSLKF